MKIDKEDSDVIDLAILSLSKTEFAEATLKSKVACGEVTSKDLPKMMDILGEANASGFGGKTDRANRRLNKTIEYVYDFQEYVPDTLVRDDRYEPHLVPGLLKGSDYSLL